MYAIHYIKDVFRVEKLLKKEFNINFKLFKGKEYFEGNLGRMIEIYWNVIQSHLVKKDHYPKPNKDILIDLDKCCIDLKLIKNILKHKLFKCENCPYITNQKYRYKLHIINKNGCKKSILCRYCPKIYKSYNP